jgi:hypothetical protein
METFTKTKAVARVNAGNREAFARTGDLRTFRGFQGSRESALIEDHRLISIDEHAIF